jgi:hypothetical protein
VEKVRDSQFCGERLIIWACPAIFLLQKISKRDRHTRRELNILDGTSVVAKMNPSATSADTYLTEVKGNFLPFMLQIRA